MHERFIRKNRDKICHTDTSGLCQASVSTLQSSPLAGKPRLSSLPRYNLETPMRSKIQKYKQAAAGSVACFTSDKNYTIPPLIFSP